MKKLLKQIYYFLRTIQFRLTYPKQYREISNSILLVYTMGKVGSSSIYRTLRHYFPFAKRFHVHFLSEKWLSKNKNIVTPNGELKYFSHLQIAKSIKSCIERNPHKRIKIITLSREPISRGISDIFQNPENYVNGGLNDISVKELLEAYRINNDYQYSIGWFDEEFKEYTGVDIYEHSFEKKIGYSIYKDDKFDILIIKLEKLNDCLESAFNDFFNIHISSVKTSNTTADKPNYDLYSALKREFTTPVEELNQLYSSKYIQHFYTETEIQEFIKKYS